MIIIATSNDSEIPIDSERTFIEKIKIGRLERDQRCEVLSWLIENKGLKHQVDLERIAKMCSDFVLADFEALVLHAIKNCLKSIDMTKEIDTVELFNDDFIHACGKYSLQMIQSSLTHYSMKIEQLLFHFRIYAIDIFQSNWRTACSKSLLGRHRRTGRFETRNHAQN